MHTMVCISFSRAIFIVQKLKCSMTRVITRTLLILILSWSGSTFAQKSGDATLETRK